MAKWPPLLQEGSEELAAAPSPLLGSRRGSETPRRASPRRAGAGPASFILPARPRCSALPGSLRVTAGPRLAPTLRLSRRDCRCFSAVPIARSRCRSSARSARLAARSAAAISGTPPPPSRGGSMSPGEPGSSASGQRCGAAGLGSLVACSQLRSQHSPAVRGGDCWALCPSQGQGNVGASIPAWGSHLLCPSQPWDQLPLQGDPQQKVVALRPGVLCPRSPLHTKHLSG